MTAAADFLGISNSDMDKVERDRFDRPMIRQPDGKKKSYRRTTTFVGCLEDTFKISQWSQRNVAYGLARRPDLLMAVQSHLPGVDGETKDDKDAVNKICDQAKEAAGGSAKATIGTALHRITERLDRGEDFLVPSNVAADVAAYREATAGLEWLHIERMMVHDTLQVAGTPDRVFRHNGKLYIGDLKTGSLDFGLAKIEMQLALYSRSLLYDISTGERTDLEVDQNRALVFHLPAGSGKCEPLWVDIAAGWEDVQIAVSVWKQRTRKSKPTPYVVAAPISLSTAIACARSEDELTALWVEHRNDWTDEHTLIAKERKQEPA